MTRGAVLATATMAFTAVVLATSPARADVSWTRVSGGSTGGISGLAPAASGWVLVRDNKNAGQNRISLLSATGVLTALTWPGTQPQDLESVAAVPDQPGQFAALTSTGRGTIVAITGTTVALVGQFTVPRGTSNIESFALTRIGSTTVAAWGTRGSPTAAARVFAASFNASTRAFGRVAAGSVTVPFPTASVRHVADLAIVGGRLVGPATSDPGANGPFTSALYDLGSVGVTSGRATLNLSPPQTLGTYSGHKVEGVACSSTGGLLGTDDEKQGGWVATESFCGLG